MAQPLNQFLLDKKIRGGGRDDWNQAALALGNVTMSNTMGGANYLSASSVSRQGN